ncbi:TetR family transcriptional regulator [Devosia epidermidihirudinis]|uniref:TetR family transcriptional regulator n=1 Tax=Devosia epidermidihirudinis TaxID=1293439 RepID=A0A0F5Q7K6_9HYPH|nr:helix-turn-helix domain-containing protein [Devosia epidermidihirudinis]KKC36626.1 TetR family transcriptional regulator [Devosia epidermidihirudinis]
MARPRTVTDEAILEAAMDMMYRAGPDALTFASVGKAVGLSAATLVQRYGTKDGFVQAAMLRGWDALDAQTAELDQTMPLTPEGAVAMLVAMIPAGMSEAENAMGLAILREDMRDPVLRARGVLWRKALARALGRRLSEDARQQEQLGLMLASQWQGAQVWWGFAQKGALGEVIGQELRDWCALVLKR